MQDTFETVLESNKDKIFRICRIYAMAPIEPQDLFQEVAYQIWRSLESFKGKSSINTWVYRITLNVCLRAKKKSKKHYEKFSSLESIQFLPSEENQDEDQLEKFAALRSCISTLKELDKTIVLLHLEELPYREIAEVTGLSDNHIAVKMKRIRKHLYNCITSTL